MLYRASKENDIIVRIEFSPLVRIGVNNITPTNTNQQHSVHSQPYSRKYKHFRDLVVTSNENHQIIPI